MNKIIGVALGTSLMAVTALGSAGCASALASVPPTQTPASSRVPYTGAVEDFVRNSATYKFDGMDGTIKVVEVVQTADGKWDFTVEYQTRQPGHGDRSDRMLAQVITKHSAEIEVVNGKVASAICDGNWNMASQIEVKAGQEFVLPVGQTVTLPAEEMAIKFDSVTADSRAPKGAQTIWAGEAKSQLQISHKGSVSNLTVTEIGNTAEYTDASFGPYRISFRLEPYPEVGKQPAAGEYRLLMKVTRNTDAVTGTPPASVPIIDNRAVVQGEVTAVTEAAARHPWRVKVLVKIVRNVGNMPNLVAGKEGQIIELRTDENAGALKVGQQITAIVKLSSDEQGTFLSGSEIMPQASASSDPLTTIDGAVIGGPQLTPEDQKKATDILKADPRVMEILARGAVISRILPLQVEMEGTNPATGSPVLTRETWAQAWMVLDNKDWGAQVDLVRGRVAAITD